MCTSRGMETFGGWLQNLEGKISVRGVEKPVRIWTRLRFSPVFKCRPCELRGIAPTRRARLSGDIAGLSPPDHPDRHSARRLPRQDQERLRSAFSDRFPAPYPPG